MVSMDRKFWVPPVLLLAFHLFCASSQSTIGWLNIDCGSDAERLDPNTLLAWDTDKDLIKTGVNKFVSEKQQLDEMDTLRSFPKGQQNCYNLKVDKKTERYLIRAGFCYGNYDGLSSPPTFDLHIDGQKWSTVKTSLSGEPIYHEVMYKTRGSGHISLCIVQVKDGGVPFISSIEAVPLEAAFPLYPEMESSYSFNLVSRVNLGGDEVRYTGILSDEKYNRIWTSGETPPNCDEVSTESDSSVENEPPNAVMSDSIEAEDDTGPIILSVDLSQATTPQSAYIVLYFTEKEALGTGDTRIIQVYIDDQMKSTVTFEFLKCKVVTIYPVIAGGPTINVTLASDRYSDLPPMISAMEVFTRVDKSSGPLLQCRFFCAFINFIISCTCLLLFLV